MLKYALVLLCRSPLPGTSSSQGFRVEQNIADYFGAVTGECALRPQLWIIINVYLVAMWVCLRNHGKTEFVHIRQDDRTLCM